MKKIIEIRLNGLNELGVQELNNHYQHNISTGRVNIFKLGDTLGIKKKRFKQSKSFESLGLENYITSFDCSQVVLDDKGNERNIPGPNFSLQLKHFTHEIYEIIITETVIKKD